MPHIDTRSHHFFGHHHHPIASIQSYEERLEIAIKKKSLNKLKALSNDPRILTRAKEIKSILYEKDQRNPEIVDILHNICNCLAVTLAEKYSIEYTEALTLREFQNHSLIKYHNRLLSLGLLVEKKRNKTIMEATGISKDVYTHILEEYLIEPTASPLFSLGFFKGDKLKSVIHQINPSPSIFEQIFGCIFRK